LLDYTGVDEILCDWCEKMQQVNVLHVIDHIGIGGAQRIVSELLNKWDKENIKMFCYVLRASNNEFGTNSKGVFFSSNHKSKYNVFSIFELKRFIETEDINILHLHLPKSIIYGVFLKIFCYKNVKIIVHEHGSIFENNFMYSYLLSVFGNKIDLFIAVSEETKRLLIKNANIKNNKIRMLYNFVDLEYFNSQIIEICRLEERENVGLNDKDFILGFAGRHVERKGCRDLIYALNDLKHFENMKLLIAGDGPKKEEYMKLVDKLGLQQNVFFIGFIPDIRWLYSIIDCFVVSSHWEPLGVVALEAHSMGVPVIAANVEGLNEVVLDNKTGLLFEPKNETDLVKKIELVYHNENLRIEITKNGLKNAEKYSLNNYLINLEEIYRELVK